ncbi:quinone-dependent dihydroorotate dehydrogenase [Gorillibacterium sp. sgz5001074]|uniref:quinone-dependent dihydroorotate dehydrogenase n=1 Tax=Gorillibacterium sp. sgz5001074 TaxID=3446695 RepID=UPI003F66251D
MYASIAKPVLFRMDPEHAHHFTINGLKRAARIPGALSIMKKLYSVPRLPELSQKLWGLDFFNPIGLAAGLDKNAQAVEGFSAMGFGFMEVGTVTPLAQPGNELPRLFRLPEDLALINRMGFNNVGTDQMAVNLSSIRERSIPVAVNIGKNKNTPNEEAEEDYRTCIRKLHSYADFFVVNISSPNTPGLRSLQFGEDLKRLLAAVADELSAVERQSGKKLPVLVKIAPDMTAEELETVVGTIAAAAVSGIIATNTTLSREGLRHPNAKETGGLSGRPLTHRSTEVIRTIYRLTGGRLPIIGSGGVFTAEDAYAKIKAGASLVEVYTALIYEGPGLVKRLNGGLPALLRRDGFSHISQAVGADV